MFPQDTICSGCGGSGQPFGAAPGEHWNCSGCGGSGRHLQMQPCPNCGGSGGFEQYAGQAPAYTGPRGPVPFGARLKVIAMNLLVLGGLAGYVWYTTR